MAPSLSVTLIDVGWGDSILIESVDSQGKTHYAIIDSNDEHSYLSSYIYLKKHFQRQANGLLNRKPVFDFVMLSHAHSDHGQGLKYLMQKFGTRNFWYPKSIDWSSQANLVRFGNRSSNVRHHQSVDSSKILPDLGDAELEVLWPPYDVIDSGNENNNSIILAITLDRVSFVLTGDAEEEVWGQIAYRIPDNTRFFKVPHHGSKNGSLDNADNGVWIADCPQDAALGLSCHIEPHNHPHPDVVSLFENNNRAYYRTDLNYHLSFQTDGTDAFVKYSQLEQMP